MASTCYQKTQMPREVESISKTRQLKRGPSLMSHKRSRHSLSRVSNGTSKPAPRTSFADSERTQTTTESSSKMMSQTGGPSAGGTTKSVTSRPRTVTLNTMERSQKAASLTRCSAWPLKVFTLRRLSSNARCTTISTSLTTCREH